MGPKTTKISREEFNILRKDVELLKSILLDDDGELSEWAKKELQIAQSTPLSEYISHDEVGDMIVSR